MPFTVVFVLQFCNGFRFAVVIAHSDNNINIILDLVKDMVFSSMTQKKIWGGVLDWKA
jgi:hypothetical protein